MAKKNESETNEIENQAGAAPITVRAQYIRDLSFESPNPLKAFTTQTDVAPAISVNVQARANSLGNNNFEVILDLNAEAKRNDEVLFIAELSYAGVFTIGEVPEEQVGALVMIDCPQLLFPFARNIMADITRDGGFPPLYLSPIDFAALYFQRAQEAQTTAN